jgi:hypothetical protein
VDSNCSATENAIETPVLLDNGCLQLTIIDFLIHCHRVLPSIFDVPRPSSSIMTSDFGVKLFRRYAHSFISVWNVLRLCSMSSDVPD